MKRMSLGSAGPTRSYPIARRPKRPQRPQVGMSSSSGASGGPRGPVTPGGPKTSNAFLKYQGTLGQGNAAVNEANLRGATSSAFRAREVKPREHSQKQAIQARLKGIEQAKEQAVNEGKVQSGTVKVKQESMANLRDTASKHVAAKVRAQSPYGVGSSQRVKAGIRYLQRK